MMLDLCEQAADGRWLLYRHHLEDSPEGCRTSIVGFIPSPKVVAVVEHALKAVGVEVRLVRHPASQTPTPSWGGKVPAARASSATFELVAQADGRVLLYLRTASGTRAMGWLHPRGITGTREDGSALTSALRDAIEATGAAAELQQAAVVGL